MIKRILTIVISTFLLAVLYKSILNNQVFNWVRSSSTIEESVTNDAFISMYSIDEKSLSYIEDKDCLNILSNIQIWSEKQWTKKPFLIFFHPLRFTGKESLILKSESFKIDGRILSVKLKGEKVGGNRIDSRYVVLSKSQFNKSEILEFYFDKNDTICNIAIQKQ